MFSTRVPASLEANRITQAVQRARAGAQPLVDLTITNPTTAGFEYPVAMLDGLTSARALTYVPEPFGLAEARRAVACDYARRGISAAPERIVLTASTSEAYSFLFKLLCAPHGDAVMVPVPSYPLFDHLTALDGVRAIPYPLDYHGRWTLAQDDLDDRWTPAVRAVLAVSPNNPTGSVLSAEELETLSSRCAERQAALIIDEVFADYGIDAGLAGQRVDPVSITQSSPFDVAQGDPDLVEGSRGAPLTFRLGGLSKSAGLPQVKLGWMLIDGPDDLVRHAMERLEVICDAYLSVSTPVQVAAPQLIEAGACVRAQILDRVRSNYRTLVAAAARHPAIEVLRADAGWSAVLRVPSTRSEEDLVVDLLSLDGVLVHPGYFFDFAREAFIIVSLLPEPQVFDDAIRRVLERADA